MPLVMCCAIKCDQKRKKKINPKTKSITQEGFILL